MPAVVMRGWLCLLRLACAALPPSPAATDSGAHPPSPLSPAELSADFVSFFDAYVDAHMGSVMAELRPLTLSAEPSPGSTAVPGEFSDVVQFLPAASGYVSSPESASEDTLSTEQQWMAIENNSCLVKPLMDAILERVPESIESDELVRIGGMLAVTPSSTVFRVERHPELVIKYQMNSLLDRVHPLVKEFWFLTRLADLGIAPKPICLSAPRAVKEFKGKTAFRVSKELAALYRIQAKVRFILMERVGQSVHQVVAAEGAKSLVWAAKLGVHMMTH